MGPIILEGGLTITQALADAETVITKIIDLIASQAVLICAFGMGVIIPAGTKAVRRLVKSVK